MAARDYNFKVDQDQEIVLTLEPGVFEPTGTTKALLKGVSSYLTMPGRALDLGCGSGVAGISLYKKGLIKPPLCASDLSQPAVNCLKKNAARYSCPLEARCGSLFSPWEGEKFDYIVDDVAGIAQGVAQCSPWYKDVPCDCGKDGSELIIKILKDASSYLKSGGLFFFPVISLSGVDNILKQARESFSEIKQLVHEEWPLPKEMYKHISLLEELRSQGCIQFIEKFGMVLYFTDIYVAYNKEEKR